MDENVKLVTIRTFDNSPNAYMLKAQLEDNGIECYLFDENMSNLIPLYYTTSGGIKLKIKDVDFDKVEALIQEIESRKAFEVKGEVIKCPQCNSIKLDTDFMSMKKLLGMIFNLRPNTTFYKCRACGFEFKNK